MANECKKIGEQEREWRKVDDENGLVLFIIFCYFAIVLAFCDHSFFCCCCCSFPPHCIKNRNPAHNCGQTFRGWCFSHSSSFSLWCEKPLFTYSSTHCTLLFLKEKSPFLFPCVHCTPMCVHGHKDVFVIWSIYRYLCYHWDCSTFIKPDGNEVDENGICHIGHWLVWTEISKIVKKKSSRRHSTEISVIFTSKSSNVRLWVSGLYFPSALSLFPSLTFPFYLFCDSYRHYFKIRFKIICFENLWVYMCYNTYIT